MYKTRASLIVECLHDPRHNVYQMLIQDPSHWEATTMYYVVGVCSTRELCTDTAGPATEALPSRHATPSLNSQKACLETARVLRRFREADSNLRRRRFRDENNVTALSRNASDRQSCNEFPNRSLNLEVPLQYFQCGCTCGAHGRIQEASEALPPDRRRQCVLPPCVLSNKHLRFSGTSRWYS